jgi:glycosyltransferase involved in cell wall biosynthesis
VFTEHGRHFPDHPRPKRKIVNRLLLGRRDRVVAVGRSVKTALVENEGIPARRVEVIANGIDTDRFVPAPAARAEVRAELGLAANDFAVMMVARLDPIKDHVTAIRACARASGAIPGLRLVVVGDGPERPKIEAAIRESNLGGRVRLLGTRHDVPRVLSGADTLLLTSVSEGIPLTVIEAMATGLPVVSTDVGSLTDVVSDGVTGLLAAARDEEAISRHLRTLGEAPCLRATMGDRGRARAIREFSEGAMADRYTSLFEDLLEATPARAHATYQTRH